MSRTHRGTNINQRYTRMGYGPPSLDKVSVYRPAVATDELENAIPPIQDYIEAVLEQNDLPIVQKLSVHGLRLVLLPTSNLADLPQKSSKELQDGVEKKLEHANESIENVNARGCIILRGSSHSFAALNFTDPRLVEEGNQVFEVIGKQREEFRLPLMAVCLVPDVPHPVAQQVTKGMVQIARQVTMSFGPVAYDVRGSR